MRGLSQIRTHPYRFVHPSHYPYLIKQQQRAEKKPFFCLGNKLIGVLRLMQRNAFLTLIVTITNFILKQKEYGCQGLF